LCRDLIALWEPRIIQFSSSPRRRGSRIINSLWIPACAGTTIIRGPHTNGLLPR
jgi:hypothetical protein